VPAPRPAPKLIDDKLTSDPAGAQVWQGPKLLGVAPLTVRVGEVDPLKVTLMHAGFDDLDYSIAAADGPSLTLRLTKHRGVARHATPPAPRAPKITPIDD
jgi:hypothetical protein